MTGALDTPWLRRAIAVVLVLALLAPVFAWASTAVGYSEPLGNAAERTGAADDARSAPSLFSGYTLPGLGDATGTFGAALLGSALTLAAVLAAGRVLD